MPFVVTEPCIQCKFTDCVAACPVDCFRDGPNFLVIDPDECIDCGACVPECPVEAIFDADAVPEQWQDYIELNKSLAQLWPSIRDAKDPLPTAEAWRKVEAKDTYLHLDAEAAAALGRTPYGPAPTTPPDAADANSGAESGETAAAPTTTETAEDSLTAAEADASPSPAPTASPSAARPSPTPDAPAEPPASQPKQTTTAPSVPPQQAGSARRLARRVLPTALRSGLKRVLRRDES